MELASSSSASYSISNRDYLIVFFLRPMLAVSFALSLLFLGWFIAWRLVLVHVPLVQEIFGLRKKTVRPKPENRGRFTQFYKRMDSFKAAS